MKVGTHFRFKLIKTAFSVKFLQQNIQVAESMMFELFLR